MTAKSELTGRPRAQAGQLRQSLQAGLLNRTGYPGMTAKSDRFINQITLRQWHRYWNGRRYFVLTSKSVPGLFLGSHDYEKIVADLEPVVRFLLKANRKIKWGGKYKIVKVRAPKRRSTHA